MDQRSARIDNSFYWSGEGESMGYSRPCKGMSSRHDLRYTHKLTYNRSNFTKLYGSMYAAGVENYRQIRFT